MRILQSRALPWVLAILVSVAFFLRVFNPQEEHVVEQSSQVLPDYDRHDHEGHSGYQSKPGSKVWNRKMSWCEKNFDCDSESAVSSLKTQLSECESGCADGQLDALLNRSMSVRSMMCPPGMWADPTILTHGDPVLPVQLERRIEEATLAHMGFEPLMYEGDDTVISELGVEPFEPLYMCDPNGTCYLMTDDGSVVITPLTVFSLDPTDCGSSFKDRPLGRALILGP